MDNHNFIKSFKRQKERKMFQKQRMAKKKLFPYKLDFSIFDFGNDGIEYRDIV